jgi:predicted nucleotidyltransferase
VYFQANPTCPFLKELQGLLVKTAGLVDVVREALAPLSHEIREAFIHGSFARSEQTADSDVDLMVVGSTGLARLAPVLRRAERTLSRPFNVTIYAPAEFEQKVRARNHFLLEVLGAQKLMIIGDASDLPGAPG